MATVVTQPYGVVVVTAESGPAGPAGLIGLTGAAGAAGPAGPAGGVTFLTGVPAMNFSQQTAAAVWLITHEFPYRPDVDLYDNDGNETYADVSHPTATSARVEWAFPMTGLARLT